MRPWSSPPDGYPQSPEGSALNERGHAIAMVLMAALVWIWIGSRAEQVRKVTNTRIALLDSFDTLQREVQELRISRLRSGVEPGAEEIQSRLSSWPDLDRFRTEFSGMVPAVVSRETGVTLLLLPATEVERP